MAHVYVTPQQLRESAGGECGGTALSETDYPTSKLKEALALSTELIERATKQWFYERDATVDLDGNDSDTLQLPVPIVDIEALYVNDSTTVLDVANYRVYKNRTAFPDDRRNPRIKLAGSGERRDIFSGVGYGGGSRFRKGRQNQRLVGTFGFTEEDGSTPLAIIRAIKLLSLEKIGALVVGGSPAPPPVPFLSVGAIVEERTDGHSVRYATASAPTRKVGLSGITANPEVEDIIRLYRAPIALAAPAGWSWMS